MKFSKSFYAVVGVAAACTIAIVAWSLSVRETEEKESTYVPKPFEITPEVELLQRYLRIDTSNPPGNETAAAKFLVAELRKRGIAAELIESTPGRGNVYARLRGRRPGGALMLYSHSDVWPATPKTWHKPPFGGEIYLDMLVGRGALDMKSVTIAHLEAFAAVAAAGRPPARDLVFLVVADEEQGGRWGMEWLLQHRPDVFEGVAYAIGEGGVTELAEEEVSYFAIETGTRQFVELVARAPRRENLLRARIALEPFFDPFDPDVITPEAREYFRSVAPLRKVGVELLQDPDGAVAEGKFWNLAGPYRALTQNNLSFYSPEADGKGFRARVVLHNLPQADPDERIAWFRRAVAPYGIEVSETSRMGPTRVSSTDTPVYRLIENAARRVHEPRIVGPLLLPWATNDGRFLRARGIHAYGIWPFKVDYFQTLGIHANDERIRIPWFQEGVRLTTGMVTEWSGRE